MSKKNLIKLQTLYFYRFLHVFQCIPSQCQAMRYYGQNLTCSRPSQPGIGHPCTSSRFQHLFKLNQNLNESVHRFPVIQGQLVRGHTMEPRKIKRFDNFGPLSYRERTQKTGAE